MKVSVEIRFNNGKTRIVEEVELKGFAHQLGALTESFAGSGAYYFVGDGCGLWVNLKAVDYILLREPSHMTILEVFGE